AIGTAHLAHLSLRRLRLPSPNATYCCCRAAVYLCSETKVRLHPVPAQRRISRGIGGVCSRCCCRVRRLAENIRIPCRALRGLGCKFALTRYLDYHHAQVCRPKYESFEPAALGGYGYM